MAAIKESQIRMALTAAKGISGVRDARWDDSAFRPPDLSERSQISANQRTVKTLLGPCLTKAGCEVEKFGDVLAQNQLALRRVMERRRGEALKRSSSVKETLRQGLNSRQKTLEQLGTLVASPQYELLNSPFLIWPTLGVFFDSSSIEPSNSWAKIKVDSDRSSGYEELSFYFLWENPSDRLAVVNVDAYLVASGFCTVGRDGGFWPGERYSSLALDAHLYLLEWWNQPPTQPLPQTDQTQRVLDLSTYGGGFGDVVAIEVANVFRGYDLRFEMFLIPPHGVVVFEVALSISYGNSEGNIHVDFASGDFEVICPAVLVAILT